MIGDICMQKLVITERMKSYHKAYFENKVKNKIIMSLRDDKLEAGKINSLERNQYNVPLNKIRDFFKERWEDIAIGNNEKLRELQKELDDIYIELGNIKDKINIIIKNVFADEYKKFTDLYSQNDWVDDNDEEDISSNIKIKRWNAYAWARLLNKRTCVYCNRQYITFLPKRKSKNGNFISGLRPDIDHYWSKSKYPIFAMSLYNWIPSCRYCNSSMKGSKEISIERKTLYEMSLKDGFKFEIADDLSNSKIRIKCNPISNDEIIMELLEMFRIEDQYQAHNNIAVEFMKKRIIYNKKIINYIRKRRCDYIREESINLLPLIIGFPERTDKLEEETLGNLKYDLAKQLEFL